MEERTRTLITKAISLE